MARKSRVGDSGEEGFFFSFMEGGGELREELEGRKRWVGVGEKEKWFKKEKVGKRREGGVRCE